MAETHREKVRRIFGEKRVLAEKAAWKLAHRLIQRILRRASTRTDNAR